MRHYKAKRDLILRALGKATFINGSQFVIAWISPRGGVDVYASELLQASATPRDSTLLDREELGKEAARVKKEVAKRLEEISRLNELGQAPTMEDDEEDVEGQDAMDEKSPQTKTEELGVDVDDSDDPDRTLVDEVDFAKLGESSTPLKVEVEVPMVPTPILPPQDSIPRPATPSGSTPTGSLHTVHVPQSELNEYYDKRFLALQQQTCKLVVKAWIKVIEPKKQTKFPYNKGEEQKPTWWPEGVRHREPDHLSKTERVAILNTIVQSPLVTVSRLELQTAENSAYISRHRQNILREVYAVAREHEKKRKENDATSDVVIHLPEAPVSPSAISPERSRKRGPPRIECPPVRPTKELQHRDSQENVSAPSSGFLAHAQKRVKHVHPPRLSPLVMSTASNFDYTQYPNSAYSYAPETQHMGVNGLVQSNIPIAAPAPMPWRPMNDTLAVPSATPITSQFLSPYVEWPVSAPGSDYSRSPNPESNGMYMMHGLHPQYTGTYQMNASPVPDQQATLPMSAGMSAHGSQPGSAGFYDRHYLQNQQSHFLQQAPPRSASRAHIPQSVPDRAVKPIETVPIPNAVAALSNGQYDYGSPYFDQNWETGYEVQG